MTDPQRLADAIDPRNSHGAQFDAVQLMPTSLLIAASDALRSSTTALEIGRAMERERCAAMADEQARAYVAYVGQRPNNFNPIKRVDRIARAGAANACHDLATAIRSTTPEIDEQAIFTQALEAGLAAYNGAPDSHSQNVANVVRAVLATLTARQQEK